MRGRVVSMASPPEWDRVLAGRWGAARVSGGGMCGADAGVGGDDLHALVDSRLGADRHLPVMTYLALDPEAADRFSSLFRQRVGLAALRGSLAVGEPAAGLAGLEAALCRAVRRHRARRRYALAGAAGGLLLAALAGAAFTGG